MVMKESRACIGIKLFKIKLLINKIITLKGIDSLPLIDDEKKALPKINPIAEEVV